MTTATKIAIGVAVAAIVAAGGYYAFTNMKKEDQGTTVNETGTGTTTKKIPFSQFAQEQNGTYKCIVNQSTQGVETSGTVYMDKSLFRGDFVANYNGQSVKISFIARDGYTYSWNSMVPTGFKVKGDTAGTAVDANAGTSGSIKAALDQIGDYNCEGWTADASVFVVPTTITFKEA